MELDKSDAAVRDSIDARAGAAEIDLYDELNAFAELSPEEQLRLVARPEKPSAEPEKVSAENDVEHSAPEQGITDAPIESLGSDTLAAETSASAETAEENATLQSAPTQIKAVELEAASSESKQEPAIGAIVHQVSLEQIVTPVAIELSEADTVAAEGPTSSDRGEKSTSFELALTQSTIESVESAATVPVAASDPDVQKTSIVPGDVPMSLATGPRPSGPLSSFNLPPELVYTGALSRGVCLACGAESDADDLFCLTCGVFIDEIGSTLPQNPTCGECNGRIETDEIFCPWCGSA